jgi:hypothetical protein
MCGDSDGSMMILMESADEDTLYRSGNQRVLSAFKVARCEVSGGEESAPAWPGSDGGMMDQ